LSLGNITKRDGLLFKTTTETESHAEL